jgi:hypothetical protein
MSETNLRASAIAEAVLSLPIELCRLTNEYLTRLSHGWSTFESISAVETEAGVTKLVTTDVKFPEPWRQLVSSNSFATGQLQWIVEFDVPNTGWIGVGVTMVPINTDVGISRLRQETVASEHDWLIYPSRLSRNISFRNGGVRLRLDDLLEVDVLPPFKKQPFARMEFDADADTGSIAVRVLVDGDFRFRQILLEASASDFNLLRPCIFMSGGIYATIRSCSSVLLNPPNS